MFRSSWLVNPPPLPPPTAVVVVAVVVVVVLLRAVFDPSSSLDLNWGFRTRLPFPFSLRIIAYSVIRRLPEFFFDATRFTSAFTAAILKMTELPNLKKKQRRATYFSSNS